MDLRSKVLSALRWTAAARFLGQLVSWVMTIFVIRLLSPEDYGIMAMAMVLIAFLIHLNTIGLDAVLVQKKDLSEQERRQIFGIIIVVGIAMFTALQLGATMISGFYGEPRLVPVIQVLSFQFLVYIFEALPVARLEREIDFKKRSIIEFCAMLTGSITSLVLAYLGKGVWALVWGYMLMTFLKVAAINFIARAQCLPSFSFRNMKEQISFGGFVSVDRGLFFAFAESDKFIGGRIMGKELLGYYSVAVHLASLPIQKLAGLLNAVAFPAFSHIQADKKKVAQYLLKAARIMSILAFPVFLGISSVAPELIAVLLGEKWMPAALPLQILAVVMPLRMLGNLFPPLLWGVGHPEVSATNYLISAIIMPAAYVVGAYGGPQGMATAWLLAYPVVFIVTVARACPFAGVSLGDLLRTMIHPVIASTAMYAAVTFVRHYTYGEPGGLLQLLQLITVGAVVYVTALFITHRDAFKETFELLRS